MLRGIKALGFAAFGTGEGDGTSDRLRGNCDEGGDRGRGAQSGSMQSSGDAAQTSSWRHLFGVLVHAENVTSATNSGHDG